jgi:membrane-associated phospholipid phosphatase
MSWIRNTDEPAERRPIDIWRLLVCGLTVVVLGVWAQGQSTINVDLFTPINGLGNDMVGLAKAVYALGSIWAALAIVVLLVVFRLPLVALRVALAAGAAWGIAQLVNEILGTHTIAGARFHVRIGDGPAFPAANVAVITAVAFALSPFAVRALRRLFVVLVILVGLAVTYLGAGLPSDLLGGVLLGMTTAAAVLVAFGSPAGKPTIEEVRSALADLGFDATEIRPVEESIRLGTVMDVAVASGEQYRVDVFGRDQRDAQVAAKWWHRARPAPHPGRGRQGRARRLHLGRRDRSGVLARLR